MEVLHDAYGCGCFASTAHDAVAHHNHGAWHAAAGIKTRSIQGTS
jgi:hypothetical protein